MAKFVRFFSMEISAVRVPGTASRRLHCPPPPDHHHVRRSLRLFLRLDHKSLSFSTSSIRPYRGAVSCVTGGTSSWSEEEDVTSREEDESPTSVPLEPIANEEQFNRIIAEAHRLEQPVIILWFDTLLFLSMLSRLDPNL